MRNGVIGNEPDEPEWPRLRRRLICGLKARRSAVTHEGSEQAQSEVEPGTAPGRAVEYVRMSTEHQQYSTENQSDAIRAYAAKRGWVIVRTYADAGKSGLRLDGRDALTQLIQDVQSGAADFQAVIVYDVSRWGRFQDADESAYYEYICRRAGISVIYCAEQFENDGSPVSTIVKGVKRAMAGEYSRELSAKVFAGQCRLIELGFRQGGPPGFGLRRVLIEQGGARKGELTRGEHKSIQTDRVILEPGPPEEIAIVQWIYRAFVHDEWSERQIADDLNQRAIVTDLGRPWSRATVHQILINPKYVGDNVWNRRSFKLKKLRVQNLPDMWIRAHGAFAAIVERPLFDGAQSIILRRSQKLSDSEMLASLRMLFESRGFLSGFLIDEAEGAPSSSAYQGRFGSLLRAYRMVGYTPDRDYSYIEINRALREHHADIVASTVEQIQDAGGAVEIDPVTDILIINGEFTASLVVVRCTSTEAGSLRWKVRFDAGLMPDITIAVRMDRTNACVLDYYLLPRLDMTNPRLRLAEHNGIFLDAFRFETLDMLFAMASRTSVLEVA
jgi:DNA invertase Pin-like site-specific DNA recombinase